MCEPQKTGIKPTAVSYITEAFPKAQFVCPLLCTLSGNTCQDIKITWAWTPASSFDGYVCLPCHLICNSVVFYLQLYSCCLHGYSEKAIEVTEEQCVAL